MRQIVLHMMMSLDGCVAGPNGELDWVFAIEDQKRERYALDLYRTMDGVLVGRETYEGMAEYWPGAETTASQEQDREFARLMNTLPKYVFSNNLRSVDWANTTLVKGDLAEQVQRLKQQPGGNLVLTGGFRLARSFVELGLIDEYQLIVHPVVLGKGKRLFDVNTLNGGLNLKLLGARLFDSGVVALHYQKA